MIKSKIFTITISCLILIETIITTKASDQLQNNLPARIRALSQLYRNNMENPIITVQQPSEPIDQNKIIMAAFSSIMFNNGGVKFNGEPVNDSNRIDCAKALISLPDFDPNYKYQHDLTPLHYVIAKYPNPDLINILITKKANINARTDERLTPLHFAIERKCNKI